MMKKSTFGAALAFFAAAAGALTAAALYLHHREKELDEYEKLLFSEDCDDMDEEEATQEQPEDEFVIPEPAEAASPVENPKGEAQE